MSGESRIRFWLIGLAVLFVLLYLLRGVLLPFVAGMAVAYFLDPVVDRLQRLGLSRLASTSLITAGFLAVALLGLLLVVPVLESQIVGFATRLPRYAAGLAQRLEPVIAAAADYLDASDIERLRAAAGEYAGTAVRWAGTMIGNLVTGGLALFNILSLLFITPVVAFYLLRDWDDMTSTVDSWLPRRNAEVIREQLREIDRTLAGFVRGQATVCLVLGLFYALGLTLVGLDLGLIVGLGAGLISFVPYLGTIIGFVIGIGLAVAQSQGWALPGMVAGVFLVGQVLEGNVLTPRLVGDRVGLHPVWVIFAILAGGALFGFVGVLLAVPVAAVIGVLARFTLRRYLSSPLYDP
ncbi:MAG: AI-2E family transporter [Alphaproteobacteria bacterium]|nr:AI-2E family transporter [Alphaproteobacteria bacterium]